MKNAGWDFSIGSQGTGTVRSVPAVKPPQARERKADGRYNQVTPERLSESSNKRLSPGNALHESRENYFLKDGRNLYHDEHLESNPEDVILSLSLCAPLLFLLLLYLCMYLVPVASRFTDLIYIIGKGLM